MALQPYIPEVITSGWVPIQQQHRLLNGEGVVIRSGWVQRRTVRFWWMSKEDVDNLASILEGSDYFPLGDGWSYEEPGTPSPILETVQIYNVTVQGLRYSAQPISNSGSLFI